MTIKMSLNRIPIFLILALFSGQQVLAREYTTNEKETRIVEGKYLLMLKPGHILSELPRYSGAVPMREYTVGDKVIVAFDSSASVAQELEQHPAVEHVEPNGLVHLIDPVEIIPAKLKPKKPTLQDSTSPDYREGCNQQSLETNHDDYGTWGLIRTSYWHKPDFHTQPYLWSDETDGSGVHAYIFDTGIELNHTEFIGRAYHGMYASEFAEEGIPDYHGHGTHVATTVGGNLYGIAKHCTVVDIKVLGGHGWGLLESNIEGLEWVVNDIKRRKGTSTHGTAKSVLNMSLAYGWHSHIFHAAMQAVVDEGATSVVAAGNSAEDSRTLTPAAFDNTITIAATQRVDDAFAVFSSFGEIVDLAAPGVAITGAWSYRSARCDGQQPYQCMTTVSGTSMATPHVAGVVARYMSAIPDAEFHPIDQEHIRRMLIETSSKGFITYQNENQATAPNRILYMGCGEIPSDQTTVTTTEAPTPTPPDEENDAVRRNFNFTLICLTFLIYIFGAC